MAVGVLLLVLAVGLSLYGLLRPARVVPPLASPTPSHQTTTVVGWVRLDDRATAEHDCEGQGRHADVGEGTPVVLTNEAGDELGDGSLSVYGSTGDRCSYTFSISDVSVDELAYTALVAERPPVTVSGADLRSDAWSLEIVL